MNEPLPTLLARARSLLRNNRRCVLCLVVGSRGSTPQDPGALMLVDDAATAHGTIGGGCVEAQVRRDAFDMLTRTPAGGLLSFKLNHDYGWDDGLICGGTLDLIIAPPPGPDALEAVLADIAARRATRLDLAAPGAAFRLHIPPRNRLYIAGAGHIGQAVARLALPLEFDVHVFDDRPDLLAAAVPAGAHAVGGDIADALRAASIDASTYCLIVTRGHRHDEQALAAVVGRGAAFVGMIGSRRKIKLIRDDLIAIGVPQASLDTVHAPVGLDIGGITVEEIAISIAAQLVQVRRANSQPAVSPAPAPAEAVARSGS